MNVHATPHRHAEIMIYMRSHSGMQYDEAAEAVTGAKPATGTAAARMTPTEQRISAYQAGVPGMSREAAACDLAVYDARKAPADHEWVMAYMRANPGMSYEDARAALQHGGGVTTYQAGGKCGCGGRTTADGMRFHCPGC